nr:hypothetical protein GCM10025732_56380 [Glycomyces mayteni]
MLDVRARLYQDVVESDFYRFGRLNRAVHAVIGSLFLSDDRNRFPDHRNGAADRVLGPGPAAPVTGPMVAVVHAGVAATAGAAGLRSASGDAAPVDGPAG